MRVTLCAVPKIARHRALPVLPPKTSCPAAIKITGVVPDRSGVICRVIQQDRERERGLDMNPVQFEIAREGGDGDVFLSITKDPQGVKNLCCGEGMPVLGPKEVPGNRASYTYCPVFQAEKERIEDDRSSLAKPPSEPEPEISMFDDGRGGTREAPAGSTYDSNDPWKKAKKDLDVLTRPDGI